MGAVLAAAASLTFGLSDIASAAPAAADQVAPASVPAATALAACTGPVSLD
ncbi:hypothetical protein AB0F91_43285 [Amycolatopsis sp. NPDC023774]|uniref:hypothetical protein n=1 Tax=Amycolatopsis sp. NPDC023774 TaxID=3155015 RepID=UPI0033F3550F